MWNDFALSEVDLAKVLTLHSVWKAPCVMLYARMDCGQRLSALPVTATSPVERAPRLSSEFSLAEPRPSPADRYPLSFEALGASELPLRPGQVSAANRASRAGGRAGRWGRMGWGEASERWGGWEAGARRVVGVGVGVVWVWCGCVGVGWVWGVGCG